ncbi:fasciclin domain-containing protein [Candidatus Bathyarchaeota archaeon]|nr:fasciclin domain-containing protein [Candidatus Bathyarchaeota archaeon]
MADIVDTAIAAGSFKTLVTAIKAAGLVGTLKSKGPFTVFAPNDEAFKKLPQGTIEALLKDIPKLKTVLTYHVVSGKFIAADMVKLKVMKTVLGKEVRIDASRRHLHKNAKVDDANILQTDILADNGVIHIIDKVILPKEELNMGVSYQIRDYMIKDFHTISSEVTVVEAARAMASDENQEGYLIVVTAGKPLGIVTENDIVNKVVAKTVDPVKTKVTEIMSSPLITIDPDDDLLEASKLMAERKVRKLVVTKDDIVYGIITANTVAQSCGRYADMMVRDILRWTAPLGM